VPGTAVFFSCGGLPATRDDDDLLLDAAVTPSSLRTPRKRKQEQYPLSNDDGGGGGGDGDGCGGIDAALVEARADDALAVVARAAHADALHALPCTTEERAAAEANAIACELKARVVMTADALATACVEELTKALAEEEKGSNNSQTNLTKRVRTRACARPPPPPAAASSLSGRLNLAMQKRTATRKARSGPCHNASVAALTVVLGEALARDHVDNGGGWGGGWGGGGEGDEDDAAAVRAEGEAYLLGKTLDEAVNETML
jgi:hypothetical protein